MKHLYLRLFILLLPFLVFYWQAPFLADKTIGNDYVAFPIQQQMELQFSLEHGTFPLYVPGFAGGHSSAALTLGQMYHPISHLASIMPGYWDGYALQWNTLLRLLLLGLAHLGLFLLLIRLRLTGITAFIISFITVYNLRMLDLFRYGASLENYTGYLFLCMALGYYYIKPSRFAGPAAIIGSTYLTVCGGHPQMMYLGLLGAGIAILLMPFVLSKISDEITSDRKRIVNFYIYSALYTAGGILLSAAYILPFYFDFIRDNTLRIGRDYMWSLEYSSSLRGMLNSIFAPLQSEVQGGFGSSSIILLIVLLPLLFAFRRKVPTPILTLWAIVVIIFICSLGKETFLHYYFWKYFPLASTFRIPGRLTMLLPFLLLLLLAWLFKGDRKHLYLYPALIAAPLFLFFNFVWVHHLTRTRAYIPRQFNKYPNWVEPAIIWIGFLSLVMVILYALWQLKGNRIKTRRIAGYLLALLVVTQVSLQMRWGTWVVEQHSKKPLSKMDLRKKKALKYYGDPGFGMETSAVSHHKRRSSLDPFLAKFYRHYICVPNQRKAYRHMAKKDITSSVMIEREGSISKAGVAPGMDTVSLMENTFNRLVFSLEVGAEGYMTLNFPYSTNWEARINGREAQIFRANGYMQAVHLETGTHRVEFRYCSSAATAGMAISCLSLLLLGLYFSIRIFSGKQLIAAVAISLALPALLFVSWYTSLYSGDNLGTLYTWSTDRFPPYGNLAYAKRTTASSEKWGTYAGLAVDGKVGPRFQAGGNETDWWQVDLGSPQEIGEIRIYEQLSRQQLNLPLEIYGSIRGKKEFTLLRRVEQLGASNPSSIPMGGMITRFLRFHSLSRSPFGFREIEVYAPVDAKTQNPLVKLVRSTPVTYEMLKKISRLRGTVQNRDAETLGKLLEETSNSGKEFREILLFWPLYDAIQLGDTGQIRKLINYGANRYATDREGRTPAMLAAKNGHPAVLALLRNTGVSLSPCIIDMPVQSLVNLINHPRLRSPGDNLVKVPRLRPFGRKGKYSIDVVKGPSGPVVQAQVTEPDTKGNRWMTFGYEFKPVEPGCEIPAGQYVHFIIHARAAWSQGLPSKKNYIAVRDLEEKWKSSKKLYFTSPQYRTYYISKIVRAKARRVLLLIRIEPDHPDDAILIANVMVFTSKKKL